MINPDNTIQPRQGPGKGSEKEKPEGVVNGQKFKEVYGVFERKKTKDERNEEWEEVKKLSKQEEPKVNKPISLFDLAKDSKQGGGEGESDLNSSAKTPFSTELPPKKKSIPKDPSLFEIAAPPPEKYMREMPDLSQVGGAEPPIQRADSMRLQKIIDQIVDHLYKLEVEGETSTVIVIGKESPLFKGCAIKITEFDTAKGQLNITIDNLSNPEAQVLIEKHEALLLNALEKKGYQVQQFVVTSQVETPRVDLGKSDTREKRENKEREPQQEKEKR